MKKIVIAVVLLMLVSGALFAQEEAGPVRFDSSTGIYYDAYTLPDLGGMEILAALFNLRVGGFLGLGLNMNDFITAGGEVGIMGMYWTDSYGNYITMFDLPFHAYADVHLGEFLALRAYGGGICLGAIGSSMVVTVAPEAGARLSLGGLYAEASYVFADTILPRYGIGFTASF